MNNVPGSTPKIICSDRFLSIISLVIADEAADDDYDSSGDEDIIRPGFDFSDAQPRSDGQNNKTDNQYNC